MLRILSIKKYTEDDEISFSQQLLQFETQLVALAVKSNKKKANAVMLLEGSYFATQRIGAENMQYEHLKNNLIEHFTGEDYKRKFETKPRDIKSDKGMNIGVFSSM